MSPSPTGRALAACLAALLQGCFVVTVPGRAPTGTFSPLPEGEDTTGSVYLEGALWPSAGANVQLPTGDDLLVDLGGQVGAMHWAANPGLWFRNEAPDDDGRRIAHRLGLEFGQGDLVGYRAWEMPFAGVSYHFQSQRTHPRHIATTTLGIQATTPLSFDEVGYVDEGNSVTVFSLPAGWFGARWSWAWPVASSGDRFVLAAGVDVELGLVGFSLLLTPLVPSPTLSLAWQFGPPGKSAALQ